jgi:hypothetical protein
MPPTPPPPHDSISVTVPSVAREKAKESGADYVLQVQLVTKRSILNYTPKDERSERIQGIFEILKF